MGEKWDPRESLTANRSAEASAGNQTLFLFFCIVVVVVNRKRGKMDLTTEFIWRPTRNADRIQIYFSPSAESLFRRKRAIAKDDLATEAKNGTIITFPTGKVLEWGKKSISGFWWIYTFWGPLMSPKKWFLQNVCRLSGPIKTIVLVQFRSNFVIEL